MGNVRWCVSLRFTHPTAVNSRYSRQLANERTSFSNRICVHTAAGTSPVADVGLSAGEVQKRIQRFGLNQLAEAPPVPAWKKLVAQFTDLVIWILIVAAVISGLMQEWADTIAILAIVIVNGIIGYLQEEKAGRALAALQKMSSPMAKVIRNGTLKSVPARELVPGDIIELEAGDNVPADSRLLSGFAVRVQEASLTG